MPVALITGGAVRVGRAITLGLARAGFDVVIHANTSIDQAQAVADEVKALGRTARVEAEDLSADEGPIKLASRIDAIDLLVNSAARYEHVDFADISRARFEAMLAVNLAAPFFLTQALTPKLKASKQGAIVNITDMAVTHAYTTSHFFAHYLASKAGLDQLTRAWALELGPSIRVNAVAPGPVAIADETTDAQRSDMLQRVPLRREGRPDDVAQAVVFLATHSYITGQTLRVDGGLSIA